MPRCMGTVRTYPLYVWWHDVLSVEQPTPVHDQIGFHYSYALHQRDMISPSHRGIYAAGIRGQILAYLVGLYT